jgi:hypothetical protein
VPGFRESLGKYQLHQRRQPIMLTKGSAKPMDTNEGTVMEDPRTPALEMIQKHETTADELWMKYWPTAARQPRLTLMCTCTE